MKRYKLVVSDFDDTLIKDDMTVSAETVNAINKLIAEGGQFVICTGRMFRSIREEAQKIGLKGYIMSYQGALISDIESEKTILHTPMQISNALKICEVFEKMGVYYQAYIDDVLYVSEITPMTEYYTSLCNVGGCAVGGKLSDFVISKGKPVTKLLAMTEPQFALNFIDEYNKKVPECLFNVSKPGFIEVIDKKASKGIALKSLCKLLDIPVELSIAIGDSLNDLSMIEAAGLGFAVGNAMDEVKKRADKVGDSNNNDAVRKIIEEYCL